MELGWHHKWINDFGDHFEGSSASHRDHYLKVK